MEFVYALSLILSLLLDIHNRTGHFADWHEPSGPVFLHNRFSNIRRNQAAAREKPIWLDSDTHDNRLQVLKVMRLGPTSQHTGLLSFPFRP